ncbi:hypothetical protein GQ44DRAFT_762187 [Phaeosphaeriaceae sp. PMI808]|nr:hypothetical protein GQ44DRAFT_762187 [Phaeosphaeriaceae sp. PMI808]
MANQLDMQWAHEELIPFLQSAFREHEYFKNLTRKAWEDEILYQETQIETITVYEDFDSTIERVRLLLVNPEILTKAELDDIGWLRADVRLCIAIFVRHAVRHDTYKLFSLGKESNPDHPRRKLNEEEKDTYVFGGKFAAKRPVKPRKHQDKNKPSAHPRSQNRRSSNSGRRRGAHAGFTYSGPAPTSSYPGHPGRTNGAPSGSSNGQDHLHAGSCQNQMPDTMRHPGHVSNNGVGIESRTYGVAPCRSMDSRPNGSFHTDPFPPLARPRTRLEIEAPDFQPGARAHNLRVGANEFWPGADGHDS